MKQYCRYCIHLHVGNGIWCDVKEKELRESTTKTANTCNLFDFCEMDAYAETDGYKPRARKIPMLPAIDEIGKNQVRLEV